MLTRVRPVDIVTGAPGLTFRFCSMAAGGFCYARNWRAAAVFYGDGAMEVDDARGLLAGISPLRWAGHYAGASGWEADSASGAGSGGFECTLWGIFEMLRVESMDASLAGRWTTRVRLFGLAYQPWQTGLQCYESTFSFNRDLDSASALFDCQFVLGQGTGSTLLRREPGTWVGRKGASSVSPWMGIRCLVYAKVGVQCCSQSPVPAYVSAPGSAVLVYVHPFPGLRGIWDATMWSGNMRKRKPAISVLLGLSYDTGNMPSWLALPKPGRLVLTGGSTYGWTTAVLDVTRIWAARGPGCRERRWRYERWIHAPLSFSARLTVLESCKLAHTAGASGRPPVCESSPGFDAQAWLSSAGVPVAELCFEASRVRDRPN